MKKISKAEAVRLLNLGIFPKCMVSREHLVPVRSLAELNNLEGLSEVQSFILYGYEEEELNSFFIPDNALLLDVNEATNLIIGNNSDDYAIMRIIGKEQIRFYSPNQLQEFIDLYRECLKKGTPFLLYWCG